MRPEAQEQATIIVGIDGTERGEDALALARVVASRDACIVLAAVPHWAPEQAAQWLSRAAASQPGIALETRLVQAPTPARGLRDLAERSNAELIVVGSTHRGWLGRIMPGSVGERLLHDAPCAVAIAPRGFALNPQDQLRTLAVAYDSSPESEAAVRFAADLAQAADASLRILTVAETHLAGHPGPLAAGAYLDIARSKHDRLQKTLDHLDQLLGALPPGVRVETWLLDGDPSRRLLEETEGDVDLLVLGSRGYGAAARVLMGSVLGTVVRSASCAVVAVPRPGATADERLAKSGATAA
jgi:nucleotide-binding universal stress UspA family protein